MREVLTFGGTGSGREHRPVPASRAALSEAADAVREMRLMVALAREELAAKLAVYVTHEQLSEQRRPL